MMITDEIDMWGNHLPTHLPYSLDELIINLQTIQADSPIPVGVEFDVDQEFVCIRFTVEREETPQEIQHRIEEELIHWQRQSTEAMQRVVYCQAQIQQIKNLD